MAKKAKDDGGAVIIKKYANRRLYNTSSSSYITLDDLAKMVRENVDFQVIDAKTGADITHTILTQIIVEEETNGEQMLPVSFLRQLIGMYGNSMQSLMPSYLEASMANFSQNQSKIREALEKGIGNSPIAKIHETNMALMKAATSAFIPSSASGSKAKSKPASDDSADSEIAILREQMAQMQKKLDELGK